MKNITQILLIVCGAFLMNSCYYDEIELSPDIPTNPDEPGFVKVKYGDDIQPIWNAKCTGCHNENNKLDLQPEVSFNELVPEYVYANDADNSPLYIKLDTGHGGASSDNMQQIKAWINQGAENN